MVAKRLAASALAYAALVNGAAIQIAGTNGAVASEVAECSQAGIDILKAGGSAADGMITTVLCVGVIAAYHSGIGGGGFGIVRFNKDGGGHDYEMIDFRETMPAAGHEDLFLDSPDPTASTIGGLSVGVPGELRGWETLHQRHGKLPWADLFQPAIKFARDGFKVNVDLAEFLDPELYPFLLNDPLWSETYAPNGTIAKLGDTIYRKRYADALEALASGGADAFYAGPIAANTVAATSATGGILTTDDLASYTALLRTPASITYRDKYRLFSTIAPSSGSIVLSTLKIFEGFPGDAASTDPAINATTHQLIQAARFGYGQRTTFGDPAFTANVSILEQEYLQPETAAKVRAMIDNVMHPATYYNPEKYIVLNDSGTAHIAVADNDGQVVSLTTTVNLFWGSQVMTEDGIILNDEMDDFSSPGQTNSFGFAASPSNFIRPGKRPQSSISSTIAEDLATGEFVMATGAAGGSRIITTTLQYLYHHLDQGLGADDTVHQGRWHDKLTNETYFEIAQPELGLPGFDNRTVAYLKGLGYNATYQDGSGSHGHVIIGDSGSLTAASDPRKPAGGALTY